MEPSQVPYDLHEDGLLALLGPEDDDGDSGAAQTASIGTAKD